MNRTGFPENFELIDVDKNVSKRYKYFLYAAHVMNRDGTL